MRIRIVCEPGLHGLHDSEPLPKRPRCLNELAPGDATGLTEDSPNPQMKTSLDHPDHPDSDRSHKQTTTSNPVSPVSPVNDPETVPCCSRTFTTTSVEPGGSRERATTIPTWQGDEIGESQVQEHDQTKQEQDKEVIDSDGKSQAK